MISIVIVDLLQKLPYDLLCADTFQIFKSNDFPGGRPQSYGLGKIYEHLYREAPPNLHSAEGDVQALMKCGVKFNSWFLRKVDASARPLRNIGKLW